MIAKFAIIRSTLAREFRDLNRTSKDMLRVSLMMPRLAPYRSLSSGEPRHRDTRAMIAKFAIIGGELSSERRDFNRGSRLMPLTPTAGR
jgi:hypothetical protein